VTGKALNRVINAIEEANGSASSKTTDASPAKGKGTPKGNKRKASGEPVSPSTKRKATPKSKAEEKVENFDTEFEHIEATLGKY
jgi:hypothetical protein